MPHFSLCLRVAGRKQAPAGPSGADTQRCDHPQCHAQLLHKNHTYLHIPLFSPTYLTCPFSLHTPVLPSTYPFSRYIAIPIYTYPYIPLHTPVPPNTQHTPIPTYPCSHHITLYSTYPNSHTIPYITGHHIPYVHTLFSPHITYTPCCHHITHIPLFIPLFSPHTCILPDLTGNIKYEVT